MTLHQQSIDEHNSDPNGEIYLLDSPPAQAKHRFYRHYLEAWLPTMLLPGNRRVRLVDAFAGSGRYAGTDRPGSPQIAVRALTENPRLTHLLDNDPRVLLQCIETNRRRAQHLEKELDALPRHNLLTHQVLSGPFPATWEEELHRVETTKGFLEPTLLFIDGFGHTGFPMDLITRVLHYESCEILINYPHHIIDRWAAQTQDKYKRQVLDNLYGDSAWRQAANIDDPHEREEYLLTKYQTSLANRGWKGSTLRMETPEGNGYHLLYGTTSERGMAAFKDAAWKVAKTAQFDYSSLQDSPEDQTLRQLGEAAVVTQVANSISRRHTGERITYAALQKFIAWHPVGTEAHLQRALKKLQADGHIPKVLRRDRRDTFTPDAVFYIRKPQRQEKLF